MTGDIKVRGHVRRINCLPKVPPKLEVKRHEDEPSSPGKELPSTPPADADPDSESGD